MFLHFIGLCRQPEIRPVPFAETREQLAGSFLIDDDLDAALDIATRIPGARIGTVEVPPVTEVEDLPKHMSSI